MRRVANCCAAHCCKTKDIPSSCCTFFLKHPVCVWAQLGWGRVTVHAPLSPPFCTRVLDTRNAAKIKSTFLFPEGSHKNLPIDKIAEPAKKKLLVQLRHTSIPNKCVRASAHLPFLSIFVIFPVDRSLLLMAFFLPLFLSLPFPDH